MGFLDRFQRSYNATDTIAKLVPAIFQLAARSAKAVAASAAASSPTATNSVLGAKVMFDYVFFNYQWVDRVAYNRLGARRDSFMDALRASVMDELANMALSESLSPAERNAAREGLEHMLDEFLMEFATYTGHGAGLKGALFYEIGRRVAETVGRPRDALLIAQASLHAMSGIKEMDVPAVLDRLR